MNAATKTKYVKIQESAVPAGLRFDVPAHCAGQIVEVAYGDRAECRAENSRGAPYMRVHDRSDRTTVYYRRAT